jgi:hypothetical protein
MQSHYIDLDEKTKQKIYLEYKNSDLPVKSKLASLAKTYGISETTVRNSVHKYYQKERDDNWNCQYGNSIYYK